VRRKGPTSGAPGEKTNRYTLKVPVQNKVERCFSGNGGEEEHREAWQRGPSTIGAQHLKRKTVESEAYRWPGFTRGFSVLLQKRLCFQVNYKEGGKLKKEEHLSERESSQQQKKREDKVRGTIGHKGCGSFTRKTGRTLELQKAI